MPAARGEVEQEQIGAIVLGEVADGDVLAVTGVIGEAERPVVEHLDESLRAAAVLNVGRAGGRDGCQERGVETCDEAGKLGRHPVGKAGGNPLFVEARRAPLCLRRSRGGGKDNVAVVDHVEPLVRRSCQT